MATQNKSPWNFLMQQDPTQRMLPQRYDPRAVYAEEQLAPKDNPNFTLPPAIIKAFEKQAEYAPPVSQNLQNFRAPSGDQEGMPTSFKYRQAGPMGGFTPINSPFNPWDVKDPAVDELNALQRQQIAQQQGFINRDLADINRQANFEGQTNLSPLLGLIDQWSGSNLSQGYSAPESGKDRLAKIAALEKGLSDKQDRLTDNQLNQLKSGLVEKRANRTEQQQYLMHRENLQNQRDLKGMEMYAASAKAAADAKGGRILPASNLEDLGDLKNQLGVIKNISKDWDKSIKGNSWIGESTVSKLKSYVPNSEENVFDVKRKAAAQLIGKALEGGKLTDADYINKYYDMIPGQADSADKKAQKVATLEKMVRSAHNEKLKSFSEGGYDTQDLQMISEPKNSQSGGNPWERKW